MTLGITVREIREGGKIIFTYDSPLSPPRIIARELESEKYHITSSSKCSINDYPYWERCAKLDAEKLKIFENVLKKILGKTTMIKSSYKWMLERINEDEIDEIIERLIRKD